MIDPFRTNKHNATSRICKDEIGMFVLLGDHGTPIKKRIMLSFKNHEKILEALEQGRDLNEILCDGSGPYFSILRLLSDIVSLKKAHQIAIEYCDRSQNYFYHFLKKTAYSAFVFLFSYTMIYFFSNTIYPQMSAYASDLRLVLFFLQRIMDLLMAGLIFFYSFLAYLFCFPSQMKIDRYFLSFPFMKKLISMQLATLLKPLFDASLPTKECFSLIERVQQQKRLQWCVRKILKQLNQGYDLKEAMNHCDEDLLVFIELGMESMKMEQMLSLYQKRTHQQMEMKLKKMVRSIQMLSYACVGALVFVAYQILLSPLNVLYTI